MLVFSPSQLGRVTDGRVSDLLPRLDAWLADEIAGWAAQPRDTRMDRLEMISRHAVDAGMAVETDYALFARLAIEAPAEDREVLEHRDIREVMRQDWPAPSKLVRFERLIHEIWPLPEGTEA